MALTIEQAENIKWALDAFAETPVGSDLSRAAIYQLCDDYYHGKHRLTFATEKFKNTFGALFEAMCENLCKPVVDVIADRLQIEGFAPANTKANATAVSPVTAKTQEIWRMNRMDMRAGQILKDALRMGDSYVIVWPDSENNEAPTIYPNRAGSVVVAYHSDKIGYITQAAKVWNVVIDGTKRIRLNLYFTDRIEKYITIGMSDTLPLNALSFTPWEVDSEAWPLPNPYDKVPVFHFANNAAVGALGRSELDDLIPLNDALNKSLADMLVAMEFVAFPQRYATGLQVDVDETTGQAIAPFKAGVDRLWTVENDTTKFGEFAQANLTGFIDVQNSLRAAISRVSGLPLHYFMLDKGGWPSGEALKTASERLTSKVLDRQVAFGNVFEDMMRFCLQIQGQSDVELTTLWKDTAPRLGDTETWQAALLQEQAGVSTDLVLMERGYTQEQIEEMKAARDADDFGEPVPLKVATAA